MTCLVTVHFKRFDCQNAVLRCGSGGARGAHGAARAAAASPRVVLPIMIRVGWAEGPAVPVCMDRLVAGRCGLTVAATPLARLDRMTRVGVANFANWQPRLAAGPQHYPDSSFLRRGTAVLYFNPMPHLSDGMCGGRGRK